MSQGFDYKTALAEDIQRLGATLVGMRLGDIPGAVFVAETTARGKGEVGLAIETFFGMPANSVSDADFSGAGIELKVVPLLRSGDALRAKERTVIGMIDYRKLVEEEWESAHVRTKLHILFVFYEHMVGQPKEIYPIRAVILWHPEMEGSILQRDWEAVRDKVRAGLAHELSEANGRLMGPCTKAADSSKRTPQPVVTYSPDAKPRAFALKPSFTTALFRRFQGDATRMQSLMAELGISEVNDFEDQIICRYAQFVGRSLGDVAAELGIPGSAGKGYAAAVVKSALGAESTKSPIKEFEEMGITVRVARVSPELRPYEAMSFPAFRYMELVQEDWVDSDLLSRLDGLFVFPLEGRRKETAPDDCLLRRPYLWKPTSEELDVAEREWTMFRDLIANGKADDLPTATQTRILHVRPHARDARDTDDAPGVGPVVKKSFWLNQNFVQELLLRAEG